MIEIKQVSKSFGKTKVLDDLSVNFAARKVIGVVGANGSGKTTFFRCLAGLEKYEGSIQMMGKQSIGFLPTNPQFMSFVTGLEYLRLFCEGRKIAWNWKPEMNIFDLPLDRYADNYSTGMKKKLALQAILMQKNQVFILDEPYNGVDLQSNLMINKLIQELVSLGKTLIISSHILATLTEVCDEIHLLEKGRFSKRVDKAGFGEIQIAVEGESMAGKIANLGLS